MSDFKKKLKQLKVSDLRSGEVNSWQASAQEDPRSLQSTGINCFNCFNCVSCFTCFTCFNCVSCFRCSNCFRCHNCFNCHNCARCQNCAHCHRNGEQ
ncbi:heterocycloanthracin/sonorensin family bacteriocin [Paenibacillus sp. NPDC056579]|uniref:heterocycloanthracin/sonorensin family bacteriocin n=1 Tax=Paenibacillus sp. NPDC056579 TaxID=3345871 RepID=UPI0036B40691